VKGEGFEVLGHEEPDKENKEKDAEGGGAGTPHEDDVKGEGFEVLGHMDPGEEGPEQTAEAADAQQAAEAGDSGETSSAGEAAGEVPMKPIDVYSVLRLSVAQLSGTAWQMMGLQPDPFTNAVRKDPDQARIAIDATAALVDLLKPHLQGQERRDYEALLTDLRLNFVSHSDDEA
jgi:hypothetical protein